MKLDFKITKTSLVQYKWLLYPVLVLAFVFITQKWLWLDSNSLWNRISLARIEAGKNSQQAASLANKLAALQKVDMTADNEILKKLNQAVPTRLDLTQMISQMQLISTNTQVPISAYKSVGDSVINVTFDTEDFTSATNLLAQLYKSLPLISIVQVSFSSGKVSVDLKSEYRTIPQIDSNLEMVVPDYKSKIAATTQALQEFQSTEILTQEFTPTLPLSANPF
jgi:hypothetical protein